MPAGSIPDSVKLAEEKKPDILSRPVSFMVLNLITGKKMLMCLHFLCNMMQNCKMTALIVLGSGCESGANVASGHSAAPA